MEYRECPYCEWDRCEAHFEHNGVGMQQVGPYHCPTCGATEIGPHDKQDGSEPHHLEDFTGWYLPDPVSFSLKRLERTSLWLNSEASRARQIASQAVAIAVSDANNRVEQTYGAW